MICLPWRTMTRRAGTPCPKWEKEWQSNFAEFNDKLIAHPILRRVERELISAIQVPAGASIILVYGPSGVGKSTVVKKTLGHLAAKEAEEMGRNPGSMPYVWVETAAPTSGNFNWRDDYRRCLEALREPLIDRKRIYSRTPSPSGRVVMPARGPHATEDELRSALEKVAQNRGVKVIARDEAQHATAASFGWRRLEYVDVLKSLSSLTKALTLLVGTYDLMDLVDLSPQLFRRTRPIHFHRYRWEEPQERREFAQVLRYCQEHPLFREANPLLANCRYFYTNSLGCVGILKCWLMRAAWAAHEDGEKYPSEPHFEKTRHSVHGLVQMAREIAWAEKAHIELVREREELEHLLDGAPPQVPPSQPTPQSPAPRHAAKAGRVGRRSPKRDPAHTALHGK